MAPTERSRTVKCLVILVAAMVIGACILLLMKTPPAKVPLYLAIRPSDEEPRQRASEAIRRTDIPIQAIKWRNIVVLDSPGENNDFSSKVGLEDEDTYHFVIGSPDVTGDGLIRSTRLWRKQQDSNHIVGSKYPFQQGSINIRLLCDTRRKTPTPEQMVALTDLVRQLQVLCQIPSDHVWVSCFPSTGGQKGPPGNPDEPGRFFPMKYFRSRLIRAVRQ